MGGEGRGGAEEATVGGPWGGGGSEGAQAEIPRSAREATPRSADRIVMRGVVAAAPNFVLTTPTVMAAGSKPEGERTIAKNRRASFDYELGDKYEAGIVLVGTEVKALRERSADITGAWCSFERGECFLNGVNIPLVDGAAYGHREAKRARKLLLHRPEIEAIRRAVERDGATVVATKIYFKEGRVKVALAIARGKKKADKREAVREREADREARAAMARGRKAFAS